ncbi:PorP/SprF family type IX secretion system membrane protein [Luteibaculum oceani]|uniref:Type IX secretion system membrane protein PorP/SprF n=1 Tax=Luteibaculum oceani TaxID=1294296 RepID=A0A5C6VJF8_9FLAO|nr:type IX secretion system membrane protein PorP/SprF [Luteibaculum oceani]TXC85437.1 type IX secretion system membrane protein PorP/SprF [Luteibaculum oceani]
MKKSFNKIALGLVILLGGAFNASAQQDPLSTLYIQNPASVNPGYSGSKEALNATLSHREQWVGFDGAPSTTNFNIHSPIQDKSLALGLGVYNDEIGPVTNTGFYVDVVYRFQVTRDGFLRVGLRGGGSLFNADFANVNTSQEQGNGSSTDPAFAQSISGEFLPTIGFGAYFSNQKFFGGISVPSFLPNEVVPEGSQFASYRQNMHVHAMAGALVELNPQIFLKPSFAVRYTSGAPVALDVTANAIFFEKFGVGVMHRLGDSFGGILQFFLTEQFTLGYSYDYTTSDLGMYNNGTHEVMLSYDFIYRSSRIRSPRYF